MYTAGEPNLKSVQEPQHVCRILLCDCIYLRGKQRKRLQSTWGHTQKGRTRSNRISSLLSGPWATKLPSSLGSEVPRVNAPHNLPLTSLQPCFSKSGLNEPQGRMPHKQTNSRRCVIWIWHSCMAPRGGWGAHTLPIVAWHRQRQEEGGGRQNKERDTKHKKVRGERWEHMWVCLYLQGTET